jgi:hypothetical protein
LKAIAALRAVIMQVRTNKNFSEKKIVRKEIEEAKIASLRKLNPKKNPIIAKGIAKMV